VKGAPAADYFLLSTVARNRSSVVVRDQMAAFVTRTQDAALRRGNRRAALNQWSTPSALPLNIPVDFVFAWDVLFDGANIWVTEHSDNKLKKLDTFGNILQSVAVGTAPEGAVFDGSNIWVANNGSNSLTVVRARDGHAEAGYSGLERDLPADASATIYFLADLRVILSAVRRGYRVVQLEAGILGGRMYLAAYGQNLCATGLTFYDDYVVQFFSPHAVGLKAETLHSLWFS
jgi:hypothetical protein